MLNGWPELLRAAGSNKARGSSEIRPGSHQFCIDWCGFRQQRSCAAHWHRLPLGENPGFVLHMHLWISLSVLFTNAAVSLRDIAGVEELHKIIHIHDRYKFQIMRKSYNVHSKEKFTVRNMYTHNVAQSSLRHKHGLAGLLATVQPADVRGLFWHSFVWERKKKRKSSKDPGEL